MRSLTKPLTRGALLAASGGEAVAFDCLECPKGVYVAGDGRPVCSCCGAPCPLDLWRAMRTIAAQRSAA